jgi:anaerobic magnesium-protoporphyrin IX monomethyl ester cyclase
MENKEYSKTKPISTLTIQVKSQNIHNFAQRIKEEEKYSLNPSDVIVSAICKKIKNFREFNSNFDKEIIYYPSVNLGYFINLGKGPEVVQIENADEKSSVELSRKIKELAMNYLHGELTKEEKQNGSFAITNLFSFDVHSVIPPIYENQSAMISISSEFETLEKEDEKIVPVKKFNLTLSYDSRVADCQKALQFLHSVKYELEEDLMKQGKKFKILLIDTNGRWMSKDKKIGEQAVLPIGLMYLSSYLKKFLDYPVEIKLINTLVDINDSTEIKKIIQEFNPDIIGMRLLSVNFDFFNQVISMIPENIKIVVGGPHVNLDPLSVLNKKEISFVVLNEGEETFLELIKSQIYKTDFFEIRGLGYKKNGESIINERRQFIQELDKIPFPDYSLIDLDKYSKFFSYGYTFRKQGVILSSRGCPFNCSYCFNFTGRNFRRRSAQNVFGEIEHLNKDYGIKDFFIVDDNFNIEKQRCIDFFNLIINSKLKINLYFTSGLRGDLMDKEFIDLMIKAGTIWVTFGVETVNKRVQGVANRNMDVDKLRTSIEYCCDKGVMVGTFFMIGFPTETKDEAMETLQFIRSIKGITMPYLFGVKFYPGTKLYNVAEDLGIINPEQRQNIFKPYHEVSTHKTDTLSETDFKELFTYFMKDIFLDKERLRNAIKTQRKFLSDEEVRMIYSTFMNRIIDSPEKAFNL